MMNLENHLHHLPQHSMENDLWDKIEEKLNSSPKLADHLPLHKVNSDLWYTIEDELNRAASRRRTIRLRHFSVAASIAIIITIGTVHLTQNTYQNQIHFSEEIYIQNTPVAEANIQENDVLENCTIHPAVCETPDFTRLKSNLDALKLKEQQLRKLKQTVNDPKMELYHSRIVKDIQEVQAQMLQMFI